MRKYGEESHLLELGGADEDTVLATKVRYQTASQEYAAFSKAMGLPQQRERIRNGMESLAQYAQTAQKPLDISGKSGIMKIEKMAAPSQDDKIQWLPKGKELANSERRELVNYAASHGIELKGLKRTDVDIDLIKETINNAAVILKIFPELSTSDLPFTIKIVNGMDASDFAMTTKRKNPNVLQLNANAFRDRAKLDEEYEKLVRQKWFVSGTQYKSIVFHELGHMYQHLHSISNDDVIHIALRISGADNRKSLFQYLNVNLSGYAGAYKNGTEIISEVFSDYFGSETTSDFAKLFMSALLEMR